MTVEHAADCRSEDDCRIASRALEEGDLQHAAFHVAGALNSSPTDAEALALADTLLQRSSDPFSLAPIKRDENFAGTLALRARFLQQKGRHGEALPLIADILRATRRTGFLEWGSVSMAALGAALELPPLLRFTRSAWGAFLHGPASEQDRRRLAQFIEVLLPLEKTFGDSADFLTEGSMALRKSGDVERALAWAERAYAIEPGFMSAIAVANSHRDREALDDYLRWIEIAAGHESDGNSALLDLGDTLLRVERYEEAAAAFTRALDKVPDHPWATPSLLYAKARLGRADSLVWRAKLVDYARDNPENEQAQRLACWAQPWTHYLPPPEDASVNILHQMAEEKVELTKMSIRLTALESPSCYLAFRLEAQRQGRETLDLKVTIAEIQKPDPRESSAEKEFELWSYRSPEGLSTDATVQLPPPDPRIRAGVEKIAREPYLLARWCELGRAYAAEIGAAKVKDVLATMVHPSLPVDQMPSPVWVQRLQFAACCTLAGMDEGWDGTLRRRALLSLLRGPVDWISGAAAMVLSEIHLACAAARPEIARELAAQIDRLPTQGYCALRKPLAAACLRLPDLPPEWIEGFQSWLAD